MVIAEALWLKTKDETYRTLAQQWAKEWFPISGLWNPSVHLMPTPIDHPVYWIATLSNFGAESFVPLGQP